MPELDEFERRLRAHLARPQVPGLRSDAQRRVLAGATRAHAKADVRRPLVWAAAVVVAVLPLVAGALLVNTLFEHPAVPRSRTAAAPSVWTQENPAPHPYARFGAAAADDPVRHEVVVFGGFDGANMSDETWTWNGTAWTLHNPVKRPSARAYAVAAFDPVLNRVVLFSGNPVNNIGLADTWTWDGTTWTQLSPPASPPGRQGAGMAYYPSVRKLVIFGGYSDGAKSILSDTWLFDGNTWSKADPPTAPPPRYGAPLVTDLALSRVVMYGGITCDASPCKTYTTLGDTWEFDGSAWARTQGGNQPGPRSHVGVAWDVARSEVVMVGGFRDNRSQAPTYFGDTWIYGADRTWRLVSGPGPGSRENPVFAYLPDIAQLLLFGGMNQSGALADTWVRQPASVGTTAPAGRAEASAVSTNAPAARGRTQPTPVGAKASETTPSLAPGSPGATSAGIAAVLSPGPREGGSAVARPAAGPTGPPLEVLLLAAAAAVAAMMGGLWLRFRK